MYKVGDEVLIKTTVVEVMKDVPYPVRVRLGSDNGGLVFTNDEVCYADKIVKTYEMGLNDAWNFSKKLINTDHKQRNEIFGLDSSCNGIRDLYERFTPQEALAKIEAYEKERKIKMGDVVECPSENHEGIVTCLLEKEVYIIWSDGSCGQRRKADLKKTGRTAEGLEGLLRQIGE